MVGRMHHRHITARDRMIDRRNLLGGRKRHHGHHLSSSARAHLAALARRRPRGAHGQFLRGGARHRRRRR